jgi:hypothetical protein
MSWVVIVFAVGSTDRIFVQLHISYQQQIHFWRAGVWVLPVIVFFAVRGVCRSLKRSGTRPLRAWDGAVIARSADGGFRALADSPEGPGSLQPPEPSLGTAPGQESNL